MRRVGPVLDPGERGPAAPSRRRSSRGRTSPGPGPPGMYSCSIRPGAGLALAGAVRPRPAPARSCDDRGAAQRAAAADSTGVVSLAISGKPAAAAKSAASPSDQATAGLRAGHAQLAAQLVQRVLARQPPGQVRRAGPGTGTSPAGSSPCSARKIAPASSVGDAAPPAGRSARPAAAARRGSGRRRPGLGCQKQPARAGSGSWRRAPTALVHPVHRHAEPAQAADHAEPAVVHDVRVELEHHRRGGHVGLVQVAGHRLGPQTTARCVAPPNW